MSRRRPQTLRFLLPIHLGLCACALPTATDDEVAALEQAIVGGSDASTGTYPSMVSLQVEQADGSFSHECGGTLVAPLWVLTAQHCLEVPLTHALIGRSDLGASGGERIALSTTRTVAHAAADIALVRLSAPSTLGKLARLASPADAALIAPGDAAYAVGWGWDGAQYPDQLQYAQLAMIDRDVCAARWEQVGGSLVDGEICAGSGDTPDADSGDSGGPLFVRDSAGYLLAGVTSWGDRNDGVSSAPGVYVGVGAYFDWIQASTRDSHGLWLAGSSRGEFSSSSRSAISVAQPVAGDFDADGKGDVLYYVPGSGKDSLAYGSGRTIAITVTRSYVPLVGDFDGNGYDDVLWYGPGSAVDTLWWSSSAGFSSASASVPGSYNRPVVGDFDGDLRDDVLWYATGDGNDAVWWGSASKSFTKQARSMTGTYRPLPGDFDGDGRDDVLWYAPGTTQDKIWWGSSARTFASTSRTIDGTYSPFTGDFDGDGRSDVFWFAPGSGADKIWFGKAERGFSSIAVTANSRYRPVVANFDGLRGDDVLWYRGAPAKGF